MKSEDEIRAEIKELSEDVRHKQKPALVDTNVVLALIQVEIQGKIDALEWVLNQKT